MPQCDIIIQEKNNCLNEPLQELQYSDKILCHHLWAQKLLSNVYIKGDNKLFLSYVCMYSVIPMTFPDLVHLGETAESISEVRPPIKQMLYFPKTEWT